MLIITARKIGEYAATAVKPELVKDFIYCSYIIVCATKNGGSKLPKEVTENLKVVNSNLPPFFKRYGFLIQNWNLVINTIIAGTIVPDAMLVTLGAEFKSLVKRLVADTSFGEVPLAISKAFGTFLRTDSENSLKLLSAKVAYCKDSFISKKFTVGIDTTVHAQGTKQLKALVKKLTGASNSFLTPNQAKELRDQDPTGYADYYSKYKRLSTESKQYLSDLLRAAGKPYIQYSAFVKRCADNGILCTLPQGFEGYLDELGNFYTLNKKLIAGKPSAKVTMNPKYNPKQDDTYVFTTPSPTKDDGIMYFYTVSAKNTNEKTKYIKADMLIKKLPTIRKVWLRDLAKTGTDQSYLACIIELIYKFAARIGTVGNSNAGEATYGLSTIEVRHVKKQGSRFIFTYPGKKGTMQNHLLAPVDVPSKRCAEIVNSEMQGKKATDNLWTYKGKIITTSMIRTYWKGLDPVCSQVSIHKLRTAEATLLAEEIMKNSPFKKGTAKQSEVEKWYKEQMLAVGKKLAHQTGNKDTSSTAIKSYIDLEVQQDFFTDLGLRIPTWLRRTKEDE